MHRVNSWVLAPLVVAALAAPSSAWANSGADANAGDVWVDNVAQPSGPGHEMDPHLVCRDIDLWGSGLGDRSGSFTINGWAPSGGGAVDYGPATWTYDQAPSRKAGSQIVAVINVQQLIAQAAKNGDRPTNGQGYHFKLQFSLDPQKHKTFWVNCPAPVGQPASPPAASPTPSPTPTPASPSASTPPLAPHPRVQRKPAARSRRHPRHHVRRHPRHRPSRRHHPAPAFAG